MGLAKFAGKGEIFMKKIENRIVIAPELEDINEILVWLKEEKENNINQYGFYNNKDIIIKAFESGQAIVFKHGNKSIGLIIWSESDNILVDIDIFVIHPSYRRKGYGELYYKLVSDYFREKGFKVVKLFCEPKTSESFWKRMGLIKFPNCGYTEHELTYYGILIDVASTTYVKNADKIELWDVEPYESDGKQPKWTWYIEFETDKLLYPIVHPCNCNWNLRWSRNNVVLKEEKVKYFTNESFEVYRSKFLYIERL